MVKTLTAKEDRFVHISQVSEDQLGEKRTQRDMKNACALFRKPALCAYAEKLKKKTVGYADKYVAILC